MTVYVGSDCGSEAMGFGGLFGQGAFARLAGVVCTQGEGARGVERGRGRNARGRTRAAGWCNQESSARYGVLRRGAEGARRREQAPRAVSGDGERRRAQAAGLLSRGMAQSQGAAVIG